MFGLDYLVKFNSKKQPTELKFIELNPRWQGTTHYQTINALLAGRVPLELFHYWVKLNSTKAISECIGSIIVSEEEYNESSLSSAGCFYIKLNPPKSLKTTQKDITGTYIFNGKTITKCLENSSFIRTILDSHSTPNAHTSNLTQTTLFIQTPCKGVKVGGEVTSFGYITGKSRAPIFSQTEQKFSKYGQKLVDLVIKEIF